MPFKKNQERQKKFLSPGDGPRYHSPSLFNADGLSRSKHTLGPQLAMTVLSVEFGLSPDRMNSDSQVQIADSR